ncbi:MAG: O-linked GlcNAc transferase [Bdellovibrionales bacterium]|nr:O-linked GlcNAc transferase [Bdellovibrionales bacterium]
MEVEIIRQKSISVDRAKDKKKRHFKDDKIATCYFNARILLEHDESALALNLLRYCVNYDSYNEIILDSLYEALLSTGKHVEAVKIAESNLKFNYSLNRSYSLANIYYLNEKDEEALKLYFDCLSNLIEDTNMLFEIYKNVANIFVKFKEFDSAEEYFYKAYQINNNSDLLLVNIGVLEFQKKDLEKSIHCFRKAIEINNNNDKAWVGLAMTHIEFGDKDLSWGNLEKALDINPNNKTALILLCQFHNNDEHLSSCRDRLIAYLKQNNFDEDISLLLIQNLTASGDYRNAYLESLKNYMWNPNSEKNQKIYQELKKYIEEAAV